MQIFELREQSACEVHATLKGRKTSLSTLLEESSAAARPDL